MTPEGEHDTPDANGPSNDPEQTVRRGPTPPSVRTDLGWGAAERSAQPPGDRLTWDDDAPHAPSQGSTSPSVRAPRAADTTPPDPPEPRPADPRPTIPRPAAAPRPAAPTAPTPPAATEPTGPTRRIPDPPKPPTPTTLRLNPTAAPTAADPTPRPAATEAEPTPPPDTEVPPGPAARRPAERERTPVSDDTPAPFAFGTSEPASEPASPLQAQLSALADQPPARPGPSGDAGTPERRPVERTSSALAELAQQLAATQSQVAAIGAQLTTLSHRLSYDIERSSQTTSERILRDLDQLPDQVRTRVSGDIGPAIDDLTDQVETDRTSLTAAVEGVQGAVVPRLASIGEIVDGLPLSHVEVLNALHALGTDLEDRFARVASRVGDQLDALERSTAAELTRLRTQVDDLRAATARPAAGGEVLDRMAGQVDRLLQHTPGSEEIVEALELLVSEHLEVLRDNLDTRVAALAPAMQQELEAVRAESLAGMAAAEEVLAERIEALEASLLERMDLALSDQVDAVDTLLADRHAQILAVQGSGAERVEELAEATAGTVHRLDDVVAALTELRELLRGIPQGAAVEAAAPDADAMAAVAEELKSLRRRISLRVGADDTPALTPEQVAALAAQIADHLH